MHRKSAVAALGIVAILALTGCGGSDREGYPDSGFRSENVATPGGTVTCVLFDGYDGDAISCDWEHSK